jgi:hypothetical protein
MPVPLIWVAAAAAAPAGLAKLESPALRAVKACWRAFSEGEATEEDLLLTLQAFGDLVNFELNQLEAQVMAGLSDPKDPIFSRIVVAFEEQLEAVEAMAVELDEPEQGHFERGLLRVEHAESELLSAHDDLLKRLEQMNEVACPFCGALNVRGSERCCKCGRGLPQVDEAVPASSVSLVQSEGLQAGAQNRAMTHNALELVKSVEAWRLGQLDWNELYSRLDLLEERLIGHQEANAQERGFLWEETQLALEASLEALDHMRLAWDKEDAGYVETGLEMFLQASDQLVALLTRLKSEPASET